MKKIVLSALIGFGFLVLPAAVFAGGKCDLTIANKTGAEISRVIVLESGSSAEMTFNIEIRKDSSGVIQLKKGSIYDIILFDNKGHKYGKNECVLTDKTAKIEIVKKDFIPQGVWDVIKKTVNL